MNRLRVNLLRRIHWTKKDCLCWHFRGGIIQSFVFVVYLPSRRFSNVALSRLWHVMNQMLTWNCHWMLGSRRHSMLRGIRLFFVCPLTFSSSFFVTHDRTYEENPPLLHSLEKWNSKLSCSLTSLICYESDDNLELWLNGISRNPTLVYVLQFFFLLSYINKSQEVLWLLLFFPFLLL